MNTYPYNKEMTSALCFDEGQYSFIQSKVHIFAQELIPKVDFITEHLEPNVDQSRRQGGYSLGGVQVTGRNQSQR